MQEGLELLQTQVNVILGDRQPGQGWRRRWKDLFNVSSAMSEESDCAEYSSIGAGRAGRGRLWVRCRCSRYHQADQRRVRSLIAIPCEPWQPCERGGGHAGCDARRGER